MGADGRGSARNGSVVPPGLLLDAMLTPGLRPGLYSWRRSAAKIPVIEVTGPRVGEFVLFIVICGRMAYMLGL